MAQKEAAKEPGNTWGSLVNVMYGLESEKVMKLGPDHFRRNENIYESQETVKRRGQRRAAITLKHIEMPEQVSESDDLREGKEAISITEILKKKVETRNHRASVDNSYSHAGLPAISSINCLSDHII